MVRLTSQFLPPVVAVLVTVLLGVILAGAEALGEDTLPLLGILSLIILAAPFVLSVIWAWALLIGRPPRLVMAAAALAVIVPWALFRGDIGFFLISHMGTGLVAALGLMNRWKPGHILMAMMVVMTPFVLGHFDGNVWDEVLEMQKQQALDAHREMLMADLGEGQEPPTLEVEQKAMDDLFLTFRRILPGFLVIGELGQAALTFGLIWILVRILGLAGTLRGLPAFGHWRMPFAVIWGLAGGVGLMIASQYVQVPWWPHAGVNLVLVMATLLAVQGAAIQWRMSTPGIPVLPRLVLMFMAGLLFLPLVLLGLADQWMDFRRLDHRNPEDSDDNGGNDDDPAAD